MKKANMPILQKDFSSSPRMLVSGDTEREIYSSYRENMKKLQIAKERRSLS